MKKPVLRKGWILFFVFVQGMFCMFLIDMSISAYRHAKLRDRNSSEMLKAIVSNNGKIKELEAQVEILIEKTASKGGE